MLVNCDVKSLEIFVAASLSRDSVLMQELWDVHNGITETDTHQKNQDDLNLPSRVIAKRFIFKLLYGASAYGYKHDSDFISVKYSQDDWQEVIDKFYSKYSGIAKWHQQLLLEAQTNGCITIPSGRYFPIVPDITKRESWPLTIIKNYPVQGFGADLVMLARLRASQLLHQGGIREAKLCGTIHDSIVCEIDNDMKSVYNIGKILKQAVEEVPSYCKKLWDYDFSLPLKCELGYGPNKTDMTELII
jgi:DNA polymerase I-like protein with 3'-5' exonuclease and polymerase domains